MDDIACDVRCADNTCRLHVNAAVTVDARQHTSSVDQSASAIGNAAFLFIDGRTRRRKDVPGAR